MTSILTSIKVLSANCQRLRTYEKKVDVLTYLKDTNAFIICLQDTHLMENDLPSVKQNWYELPSWLFK